MRSIAFLLAVILLLSNDVDSQTTVDGVEDHELTNDERQLLDHSSPVDDAAGSGPSNEEQQLLNLHLRLERMFVETSEQIEELSTELHHLRQSIEHLGWMSSRLENVVRKVESDNDLLVRNITILTQQSDNIVLNQQYCANHEALKNLFFELTPRCGALPPEWQQTTTGAPPVDNTVYRSCAEAPAQSGVYRFARSDGTQFRAYCEQEQHGGGWMAFQSRQDGSVNFNRSWVEYREGFGDASGEYWLGLESLHQLTKDSAPQLLVVMEDYNGHSAHAIYQYFWIEEERLNYIIRMNSSTVSGTAGDSLYQYYSEKFVTYDHASSSSYASCAETLGSGFWHYQCVPNSQSRNNLNGVYGLGRGRQGIWWGTFPNTGQQNNSPLKLVKMMIKY